MGFAACVSSELKSNGLGRFIRARTISDAWHRGLNLIWREGQEISDERGTRIRELLSLQVVVEDPYQEMIPDEYSWNEERLKEYANQLQCSDNPGFEYTWREVRSGPAGHNPWIRSRW